jgi:hypothetical protein
VGRNCPRHDGNGWSFNRYYVAINFIPKNMVGIGLGLIAIGAALLIVSKAIENMGGMSLSEIAKGLVALEDLF